MLLAAGLLDSPSMPRPVRWYRFSLILLSLAAPLTAQPVRLSVRAFGAEAEVEVRDLPREAAGAAAQAALLEIHELSQLVDPGARLPGSVGALNALAGTGPQPVDERMAHLLVRGLQYCLWSNGTYGPLGGRLYRFWATRQEAQGAVEPAEFGAALDSADCSLVTVRDQPSFTVTLAEGSRIDLWGIARGFAVDRAMQLLEEREVKNAWVQIGSVRRALGGGAGGNGWAMHFPSFPGMDKPLNPIWLHDQAVAVATMEGRSADPFLPYLDQRTGRMSEGIVAIIAITEQASDAEALTTVLMSSDLREGQRRLGSLRPRPAVLWLLGQGTGRPLEASYNWSEVPEVKGR